MDVNWLKRIRTKQQQKGGNVTINENLIFREMRSTKLAPTREICFWFRRRLSQTQNNQGQKWLRVGFT